MQTLKNHFWLFLAAAIIGGLVLVTASRKSAKVAGFLDKLPFVGSHTPVTAAAAVTAAKK